MSLCVGVQGWLSSDAGSREWGWYAIWSTRYCTCLEREHPSSALVFLSQAAAAAAAAGGESRAQTLHFFQRRRQRRQYVRSYSVISTHTVCGAARRANGLGAQRIDTVATVDTRQTDGADCQTGRLADSGHTLSHACLSAGGWKWEAGCMATRALCDSLQGFLSALSGRPA